MDPDEYHPGGDDPFRKAALYAAQRETSLACDRLRAAGIPMPPLTRTAAEMCARFGAEVAVHVPADPFDGACARIEVGRLSAAWVGGEARVDALALVLRLGGFERAEDESGALRDDVWVWYGGEN